MPSLPKRKLKEWIKMEAATYGKRVGDVTYIFCTNEIIKGLNKQYLSHNYNTDVITFDYSRNNSISGDIFISLETVTDNALDYKESFQNELYRVMIHGVLHLCGIQDITDDERAIMRQHENEALRHLNNLLRTEYDI